MTRKARSYGSSRLRSSRTPREKTTLKQKLLKTKSSLHTRWTTLTTPIRKNFRPIFIVTSTVILVLWGIYVMRFAQQQELVGFKLGLTLGLIGVVAYGVLTLFIFRKPIRRWRRVRLHKREAKLSNFSRMRLVEKARQVKIKDFIAEWRLPATEHFFNLDHGRGHKRTIWAPLGLFILATAFVIGIGFLCGTYLTGLVRWSALALSILPWLPAIIWLWMRWASVHYKRAILTTTHIIFIDSPPFFSGGGVLPYELRQIDRVNTKTVRTRKEGDDSDDSFTARLLGSIAAWLDQAWHSCDTEMQHDAPLPWFGPYVDPYRKSAQLDQLKDMAKLNWEGRLQEGHEDIKDRRRKARREEEASVPVNEETIEIPVVGADQG